MFLTFLIYLRTNRKTQEKGEEEGASAEKAPELAAEAQRQGEDYVGERRPLL